MLFCHLAFPLIYRGYPFRSIWFHLWTLIKLRFTTMDISQTHLEGGGNLGREIDLLETSWWVSGSRECSLTVKSLDYDFNLFDSNSAFYHLPSLLFWASYLLSLWLSFFILKMWAVIVSASHIVRITWNNTGESAFNYACHIGNMQQMLVAMLLFLL